MSWTHAPIHWKISIQSSQVSYESIMTHIVHDYATQLSTMLTHLSYNHSVTPLWNTSWCLNDRSLNFNSYCIDSPYSIFILPGSLQARWLRKISSPMQSNLHLRHFLFHPLPEIWHLSLYLSIHHDFVSLQIFWVRTMGPSFHSPVLFIFSFFSKTSCMWHLPFFFKIYLDLVLLQTLRVWLLGVLHSYILLLLLLVFFSKYYFIWYQYSLSYRYPSCF